MVLALLACALMAGVALAPAAAAAASTGYRDASFVGGGGAPTGEKPQSKLWFNDGLWWGAIWQSAIHGFSIQRFDVAKQTWTPTSAVIDSRNEAQIDALWDGHHLYTVASLKQNTVEDPSVVFTRFSYDPATQTYAQDSQTTLITPAQGTVTVTNPDGTTSTAQGSTELEVATIDEDSTGMLWVTYTMSGGTPGSCADAGQACRTVYVQHTKPGSDTQWAPRFKLPTPHSALLSGDDVSTVVHFGSSIGVFFDVQSKTDSASVGDYLAVHQDGAADGAWTEERTPLQGSHSADDHFNVKADPTTGDLYAVAKTSVNDLCADLSCSTHPNDPLIVLLVRRANGSWSQATFDTAPGEDTRPQVMLDPAARTLYVFATYPPTGDYTVGGWIYYKSTSMDSPAFAPGRGDPWVQFDDLRGINNVSSTKQPVNAASGLLAIACDHHIVPGVHDKVYVHNYLNLPPDASTAPPPPPPPPVAPPAAQVPSRHLTILLRALKADRHRALRRHVLGVRLAVSAAARVSIVARGRRRGPVLARARVTMTAAGVRVVRLRLTSAGLRHLRAHRTARLRVGAAGTGADGSTGSTHVTVRVR